MDVRRQDNRLDSASFPLSPLMVPGENRGRLGFVGSALRAFSFLGGMGFVVVRQEPTLLRLVHGDIFVNLYQTRGSYTVGLELGTISKGEIFSLHEVLKVFSPADARLARLQPMERQALVECLTAIANVLAKSCHGLLAGEPSAFARLSSEVRPRRKAGLLRAQFGAVMNRADRAWEQKDLLKAMALYGEAEEALDATRRRRLTYLRSKIPFK